MNGGADSGSDTGMQLASGGASVSRNDINQFGKKGQGDRWLLDEKFLHHTASMNFVRAGSFLASRLAVLTLIFQARLLVRLLRTFMTRQQANTFLSLTVLA